MDLHYGSKADVRFSPSSDELLYQLRLLDVLIHIVRVLCSFLCALMGVGAIMEECCFSDCGLMSWAAFFEGVVFDFYAPLMGGHTLRSGLTSETMLFGSFPGVELDTETRFSLISWIPIEGLIQCLSHWIWSGCAVVCHRRDWVTSHMVAW